MVFRRGRVGFLALAVLAFLGLPGWAAELDGTVDTFVSGFNSQSRSLGADVVFVETECKSDPSPSCKFVTATGMAGYVQSHDASANASTVTLLKGEAAATDFVLALGVLMSMFAGDVDKDERGAALMHMLKQVTEEGVTGKARLSNSSFSLSQQSGVGVMAVVEVAE